MIIGFNESLDDQTFNFSLNPSEDTSGDVLFNDISWPRFTIFL